MSDNLERLDETVESLHLRTRKINRSKKKVQDTEQPKREEAQQQQVETVSQSFFQTLSTEKLKLIEPSEGASNTDICVQSEKISVSDQETDIEVDNVSEGLVFLFNNSEFETVEKPKFSIMTTLANAISIISDYNGSRSNLHKFITCCDFVFKNPSADFTEELFIGLIKTKLSDRAYDVVRHNSFKSWKELKAELISEFSDSRPVEQLQLDLVNATQGRNEDVLSFANRVGQILADLNAACILREGEEAAPYIQSLNSGTALKSFVDGLRDEIRLVVNACRFTKLKDAISKAVEEETSLKTRKSCQINQTPLRIIVKCQICKKSGHSADVCYQRNRTNFPQFSNRSFQQTNQPNSSTSSNIKQINLFCNYCKNTGHNIKNCRKRKYNEEHRKQSTTYVTNNENNKPSYSGNDMPPVPNQTNTPVQVGQL